MKTTISGGEPDLSVPIVTFSWADFPCVGKSEGFPEISTRHYRDTFPSLPPLKQRCVSDCSSDETSSTASIDSLSDIEDIASASRELAKTREPKRRVSFSPVLKVRTHQVVLGDHPCCSGGLALEFGWKYTCTELLDLDTYEHAQAPQRRRLLELRLSYGERRERLQSSMGLSGAQLLRLEHDLISCNHEEAEHQRFKNHSRSQKSCCIEMMNKAQYSRPFLRPLHHAGSFSMSLDQQPYQVAGQTCHP